MAAALTPGAFNAGNAKMELTKTQALIIAVMLVVGAAFIMPGCGIKTDPGVSEFWRGLERNQN